MIIIHDTQTDHDNDNDNDNDDNENTFRNIAHDTNPQ